MSELDDVLASAVTGGAVPYAVAAVAGPDRVAWEGSAGDAADGRAAGTDTVFRLWSMTKAIGSLAALILVDRKQLSLDTVVADILPEIGELAVVESIGDDGPVLRPARTPITLRHLLTHTSGLAYPLFDETMIRYMTATGRSYVMEGRIAELSAPLMFEPGRGWTYGIGMDWVGYLVQQVAGKAVDRFCQEEIFVPLGLKRFSFRSSEVAADLGQVFARDEGGGFIETEFAPPAEPELFGMGNALYGTAGEYLALLRLVLRDGELDGTRLLSSDTAALMKTNLIGEQRVPPMRSFDAAISADVDLIAQVPMSHTAAFLRTEQDISGMRSAGSLWWAGFLNTHYWIDPARSVAAVFMTQSLPFCDARCMASFAGFERAVYASLPQ